MSGAELQITFLGTGSAVPSIERQQSCIALRHQSGLVLFDCGEGSQYALRRYKISTRKELVIWISHLHSDHFLGLPGILASFELLGREEPITIVGPKYIDETVNNLIVANYIKTSYQVNIVTLQPGDEFKGSGYTLETIKSIHGNFALSVIWREDPIRGKVDMAKIEQLGIKPGPHISDLLEGKIIKIEGTTIHPKDVIGIERKGRSVFYSGDTEYNENIIKFARECDLFIHEATYPSDMVDLAKERQHTTTLQATKLGQLSLAKSIILTHISPRVQNFNKELKLCKKLVEDVKFAEDGLVHSIDYMYSDP